MLETGFYVSMEPRNWNSGLKHRLGKHPDLRIWAFCWIPVRWNETLKVWIEAPAVFRDLQYKSFCCTFLLFYLPFSLSLSRALLRRFIFDASTSNRRKAWSYSQAFCRTEAFNLSQASRASTNGEWMNRPWIVQALYDVSCLDDSWLVRCIEVLLFPL